MFDCATCDGKGISLLHTCNCGEDEPCPKCPDCRGIGKESREDIELSDGGVIEAPDDKGTIRRRDVNGNCEEIKETGDADWTDWGVL